MVRWIPSLLGCVLLLAVSPACCRTGKHADREFREDLRLLQSKLASGKGLVWGPPTLGREATPPVEPHMGERVYDSVNNLQTRLPAGSIPVLVLLEKNWDIVAGNEADQFRFESRMLDSLVRRLGLSCAERIIVPRQALMKATAAAMVGRRQSTSSQSWAPPFSTLLADNLDPVALGHATGEAAASATSKAAFHFYIVPADDEQVYFRDHAGVTACAYPTYTVYRPQHELGAQERANAHRAMDGSVKTTPLIKTAGGWDGHAPVPWSNTVKHLKALHTPVDSWSAACLASAFVMRVEHEFMHPSKGDFGGILSVTVGLGTEVDEDMFVVNGFSEQN